MEDRELEESVRRLVAEHLDLPLDTVDLEMSVEEAANSLELSTLMVALEKRFEVTFADNAIGTLRILRDLVTLVAEARS